MKYLRTAVIAGIGMVSLGFAGTVFCMAPSEDVAVTEPTAVYTEVLPEYLGGTPAGGNGGTISANEIQTVSADTVPAVVVDQSAPVFLSFNSKPVVKVGTVFDIHKYIGYGDDVDRNVDLQVIGEVNTAVEGVYPLQITLLDDAGHTTSRTMNVQVSGRTSGGTGNTRSEQFSDFIRNYKTENTSVGIDISRWQGTVDFAKVKAAGCEFVYMRIGGLDDGALYTDRCFRNNIAGARAAGLKIGLYWHAEESTPEQVHASVAYLLQVLGGEPIDFPIAYDWEDFQNFENYGMSLTDLNNNLDTFVADLQAAGYSACLYNSKYYLETIWTSKDHQPVWLANYTSATTYQGPYFMWQHACTGRIDGISGAVDLDVLYHDAILSPAQAPAGSLQIP